MSLANARPGAIILAGGQSRRMGKDKALLKLAPEGPRLIELALASVVPLVEGVIISANRPEAYSWLGWPVVADNFPGTGPLAGLEAGLDRAMSDLNLVVACDLPFIQTELLAFLLTQVEGYEAVIGLNKEGRPEPLCAVYSRACLPVIRRHLQAGSYKMTGWLNEVRARYVAAVELEKYDPGLQSFINLNRPADLEELKAQGIFPAGT